MSHEHKLTVYTVSLDPIPGIVKTNRQLLRCIINEDNTKDLIDSVIIMDFLKKFISKLDTDEMYTLTKQKKCITANQPNISQPDVKPNINFGSEKEVLYGVIEGGNFGKKRKKRNVLDKKQESDVGDKDAITDNFFFLLYFPLTSDKMVLMIQSYTDESVDSVIIDFFKKFLTSIPKFRSPTIKRFIPKSIIENFKENSVINKIEYSTNVTSETLLEEAIAEEVKEYKVTVKIEAIGEGIEKTNLNKVIEKFEKINIGNNILAKYFTRKRASLRESEFKKTSSFEIGSDFDIKPLIILDNHIELTDSPEKNFEMIEKFCFKLLDEIVPEIYSSDAIQER